MSELERNQWLMLMERKKPSLCEILFDNTLIVCPESFHSLMARVFGLIR